jgi:hypothetical protein
MHSGFMLATVEFHNYLIKHVLGRKRNIAPLMNLPCLLGLPTNLRILRPMLLQRPEFLHGDFMLATVELYNYLIKHVPGRKHNIVPLLSLPCSLGLPANVQPSHGSQDYGHYHSGEDFHLMLSATNDSAHQWLAPRDSRIAK